MDWKTENKKNRYIDSINWEEAKKIAFIASGKPDNFKLKRIEAKVNGNNVPHVELHYSHYEPAIGFGANNKVGIFENLNSYLGEYSSCYCQKELFSTFKEMGFD